VSDVPGFYAKSPYPTLTSVSWHEVEAMLDRIKQNQAELHLSRRVTFAFCGPGRSGKDESAEYLRDHYGLRFAGSLSQYLAPYMATKYGVSVEQAFAERHKNRMDWYEEGKRLRAIDPEVLTRPALEAGDILSGVRDNVEIDRIVAYNLVTLRVWIERNVDPDPMMEYGAGRCHVIVDNNGTKAELYARLDGLAALAGLVPRG
jgi:hypothetical protein